MPTACHRTVGNSGKAARSFGGLALEEPIEVDLKVFCGGFTVGKEYNAMSNDKLQYYLKKLEYSVAQGFCTQL